MGMLSNTYGSPSISQELDVNSIIIDDYLVYHNDPSDLNRF